ncbi:MAG: hypothetical protein KKH94_06850 [Candidatus Omnitrophica bacterium]|nr:hypothetical protein [Candidatus Omnitrophota bacterium]
MDAVRIIDLWQVILQEPRVAQAEAALLMQGELEQFIVDKNIKQQQRLARKTIQKTLREEGQLLIVPDRRGGGDKPAVRMLQRKKKDRTKRQATNKTIVNAHHVDIHA